MTRTPVSKSIRFEVFKRDRFTCQYCGATAPEAVLHCDHIHPVAEGGDNDLLNLVTACSSCNLGKGAKRLDDRSAVQRQRAQLEELDDRREQLEMMLEWRDKTQAAVVDTVEEVANRVGERSGSWPNDAGKADIRRWLKRYSLAEILSALDESFDRFLVYRGGEVTDRSWGIAFDKIPVLASYARRAAEKPHLTKLVYIQGILRRRFDDPRGQYLAELEDIFGWGVPLEAMEGVAKVSDDMGEYWDAMVVHAKLILAQKEAGSPDGQD